MTETTADGRQRPEHSGRFSHRRARWVSSYRRFVAPAADGLPTARVLLGFPAVLLILGVILVSLSLNGSSSGAFYDALYEGDDPALIAGHPQSIRSDEWTVGTVWTISQIEQGLPERNQTFPGGMDAALPYDLPRAEWSVAFRPHLLGYLFLDADHGTAWRWWLPGLALIAAAYAFVVTVLPRRPLASAALAVGFFYSPFFQWWYQSSTLFPVIWALATMASILWALNSSRRTPRWIWAAIISYLTIVMALGIYAPFIIPVVIVVAFLGIGLVIDKLRRGMRWRDVLGRLVPTLVAAVVAVAVTGGWLASKAATVEGFLGTAYPGERLSETGAGGPLSVARALGFSFSQALELGAGFLGINSSEASTFFLAGAFLLPIVAFAIWQERRHRRVLPWALISLTAVVVLFLAYMLLPGWDALSRLLLLDRTTADRTRIGVGLASFALLVFVVRYLIETRQRLGVAAAATIGGLYLALQGALAVAVFIAGGDAKLWAVAPTWWVFGLASALTLFLFARRHVTAAAVSFMAVLVASSVFVNPVYVGVFDLRETAASKAIMRLDDDSVWVGIGDPVVTATLLESGVTAYNGTQGAPSREMWSEVDPTGQFEHQWNRIGTLLWEPGEGEPTVTNPAPDWIEMTFDGCSDFAQENVTFVLSNRPMVDECLLQVEEFPTQGEPLAIYRVTPAS